MSVAIGKTAESKLVPLGYRVYAIVNYDNFSISPELLDEYSAMVRSLTDRFYSDSWELVQAIADIMGRAQTAQLKVQFELPL